MKLKKLACCFAFLLASSISLLAQSTFAPVVTYPSGGVGAVQVAIADVNVDGKPDLLVLNDCITLSNCGDNTVLGAVGVLLGKGDGTFQPALSFNTVGPWPMSIAVGEFNGDGKPDIVIANRAETASVLLGNGDGTFQPPVDYDSGGVNPFFVAVADVNGDGKPDLLVSNMCIYPCAPAKSLVGVLLGNGDGTFQPAVTYFTGAIQPESIAVGDVNGDGKPDVAVAHVCDPDSYCGANILNVGVLLGNGDGTFQPVALYTSAGSAWSIAIGDVNGDHKLDLLVGTQGLGQGIGVLLGNGNGTFQSAMTYPSGGSPMLVTLADANLDGTPDLLAANQDPNAAGVLLGNGDGTFQTAVTYESGGYRNLSLAMGDVNGDGKPDAVVTNYCATIDNCDNGTVGVLINVTPSPYRALVQQPINSDGSSIFKANRGVVPVKFALTQDNAPTCELPAATIAVSKIGNGTPAPVDEKLYSMSADSGSDFRIDNCQYVYNLAALAVGAYSVDIKINGAVVGNAVFAFK